MNKGKAKMNQLFIILLLFIFPLVADAQMLEEKNRKKIIVNDSLYQQQSDPYNFDKVSGNIVHNVLNHQIEDINDLVIVEEDSLKFQISFACGCGSNKKQLVTNGQLLQDQQGHSYYPVKFIFTNFNKGCEAGCHERLSFDISALKKNSIELYLKLDGFEQLIPYK